MLNGPVSSPTPKNPSASRSKTLSAPDFGASSNVQASANSTPGIAIGIRISAQARLRQGMSVRSISQANPTAIATVITVLIVDTTSVVASAW